jgi:tRNA(adenine34) deaminase
MKQEEAPEFPKQRDPDEASTGDQPDPQDVHYMRLALSEAAQAAMHGEVPVGAVAVLFGEQPRVIGSAGNRREEQSDPTAHAEILAMRQAARYLGSWRLCDVVIYVTQEPCPMCAGALVNARVTRLVYGCDNPKAGAVRTLYRLLEDARLNHRMKVQPGVLAKECGSLLKLFFENLRRSAS